MKEIKFDQHYMIDETIIDKIISLLNIAKKDVILEIGPGKGALTKKITKHAKKVICVEIDYNNSENLNFNNCEIITGNALDYINKIECDKIVSNLPYSLSEPLFKKLIKKEFEMCIFTIGKRFYKIISDDKNKLFYLTNSFFNVEFICDVEKEIFKPKPKVNSCIIKLIRKKEKTKLEKIGELFFLQNDKLLKNALINIFWNELKMNKKNAKKTVNDLEINIKDLNQNVDLISNEEFIKIIKKIKKIIEK